MRYVVKYIGNHQYGVIDTMAPKSVVEDQPHGHVLLWTNNGSQAAQIAADALNASRERVQLMSKDTARPYIRTGRRIVMAKPVTEKVGATLVDGYRVFFPDCTHRKEHSQFWYQDDFEETYREFTDEEKALLVKKEMR